MKFWFIFSLISIRNIFLIPGKTKLISLILNWSLDMQLMIPICFLEWLLILKYPEVLNWFLTEYFSSSSSSSIISLFLSIFCCWFGSRTNFKFTSRIVITDLRSILNFSNGLIFLLSCFLSCYLYNSVKVFSNFLLSNYYSMALMARCFWQY